MEGFVKKDSIVKQIWGKSDTVLFIFAGAAAEFALNKAVDWLYFTGKLPTDPIGRLFSTVRYAKMIVFAPKQEAEAAIATMAKIHLGVEKARGARIPDWAYRDVLFMLIFYSIAAFELLERELTQGEKQEVFKVFYRVGRGMGLKELPADYPAWCKAREAHLANDLEKSELTIDLFMQYRMHLGGFRYFMLIEAQKLVIPQRVRKLMAFKRFSLLKLAVPLYKFSRQIRADGIIKAILLPAKYKNQIRALDVA